jgi:hypothetical protein
MHTYSTEHTAKKGPGEEKGYSHAGDEYTRSKRLGKKR